MELQTQESKKPLVGEEKKFEVALKSKLIKDASFEELKEVLRLVMIKVGLRAQNWPSDIEKLVLTEHIVSEFGGNRLEEIKLAFDMAINGKLDCEVNCYENFSCLYFSSIMNAYRKWSTQAYNHVSHETEKPMEQKIFTPEENENIQREDAERQYRLFIQGTRPKAIEFNSSILVKDGFIKEGESVLEFFKKCFEKGYRHIYTRQ